MYPVKQSTALDVLFFAHDANGDAVTGKVDGDWTKNISKNAAAFAAMTVTITERAGGWYLLPLSAVHSDTLGVLTMYLTATGVKQVNLQFRVTARITDDLATSAALTTVQADTDDIQTRLPAALVSGRMDSSVGAMAADVLTASALAAGAVDEVVNAVWDETTAEVRTAGTYGQLFKDNVNATISSRATPAQILTTPANLLATDGTGRVTVGTNADKTGYSVAADGINAAALAADVATEIRSLASGTADSGTTTTMVDAARTEADADYWAGALIVFTSGTLLGQSRRITAFNAATDTITFTPATTVAVGTHTYEIWPGGRADIGLWLGAAPSALIAGRVDANAQVVGDKTGYALGVGGIAATAFAAGAIDSAAVGTTGAQEIANELLKRDMSLVTGEAARSPINALRLLRNKRSIASNTLTVTKEDDITAAWTGTTATTAGDPISSVDPA